METVTISPSHGSRFYDISTIEGIALDKFTHIQIYVSGATRSSSGSFMGLKVSEDGSTFKATSGDYIQTNNNAATTNVQSTNLAFYPHSATSDGGLNLSIWLTSFNQPCPTGVWISEMDTADAAPLQVCGMTTAAAAHKAIRFDATVSGGASVWNGGTVYLVGYRCKVGTLYTHTWTGDTSVTWNLAAGEFIGDFFAQNVASSGAAAHLIQVGTGGTPLGGTDYRRSLADKTLSSVVSPDGGSFFLTSGGGNTAKYGMASIFNLRTAAPVQCMLADMQTGTDVQEIRSFLTKTTTAYDQVTVAASAATFTSGTVYLQTYKPRQTILRNTAVTSGTSFAITGLNKQNSSLIVAGSHDLLRASADNSLVSRVSTNNGSSYDSGASDYLYRQWEEATDSVVASSTAWITDFTSRAEAGFAGIIVGLPQNTPTQWTHFQTMSPIGAATVDVVANVRTTAQRENAIQFSNLGAVAFTSGTPYIIGYSL